MRLLFALIVLVAVAADVAAVTDCCRWQRMARCHDIYDAEVAGRQDHNAAMQRALIGLANCTRPRESCLIDYHKAVSRVEELQAALLRTLDEKSDCLAAALLSPRDGCDCKDLKDLDAALSSARDGSDGHDCNASPDFPMIESPCLIGGGYIIPTSCRLLCRHGRWILTRDTE